MKKYYLAAFMLLAFSQPVSAVENTSGLNTVEPNCSTKSQEGSFIKRSGCSGSQKERYYIDEKEVPKVEFDKKKAFYDVNGELCKETRKTKSIDLPKGFSVSCTKGKYGKYYVSGKKVTYAVFTQALLASAFGQAIADGSAQIGEQLRKQQKELLTYKKFLTSIENPENILYSTFPQKGQKCIGTGTSLLTMNGEGTKTFCADGVITEVEYYFNNKTVSFEVYTKKKYKVLKASNKKALKDWRKNNK